MEKANMLIKIIAGAMLLVLLFLNMRIVNPKEVQAAPDVQMMNICCEHCHEIIEVDISKPSAECDHCHWSNEFSG